jgi:hypothetical protein
VAAGALSILALVQGLRAPVITPYDVDLQGLPPHWMARPLPWPPTLHVGEMVGRKWLPRRVEQIQALRADLIILAGDIVEGDSGAQELLPVFRQLSAPCRSLANADSCSSAAK